MPSVLRDIDAKPPPFGYRSSESSLPFLCDFSVFYFFHQIRLRVDLIKVEWKGEVKRRPSMSWWIILISFVAVWSHFRWILAVLFCLAPYLLHCRTSSMRMSGKLRKSEKESEKPKNQRRRRKWRKWRKQRRREKRGIAWRKKRYFSEL